MVADILDIDINILNRTQTMLICVFRLATHSISITRIIISITIIFVVDVVIIVVVVFVVARLLGVSFFSRFFCQTEATARNIHTLITSAPATNMRSQCSFLHHSQQLVIIYDCNVYLRVICSL